MERKNPKNAEGWRMALQNLPQSYKEWFKEEKEFLLRNIKKDSKILEVGCGDGRSLNDLLEISENLTGLDIDEKAVKIAKEKFSRYQKVKIVLGDARNLPFKEKLFDYITCIGTFANFGEDKFIVLNEIKRVLKDDGKIIISVYSNESLKERVALYNKFGFKIKRIEKDGRVIFDDVKTEGISEQFSEKQLRDIASKSNFNVDKVIKTKNRIAYLCVFSKKELGKSL